MMFTHLLISLDTCVVQLQEISDRCPTNGHENRIETPRHRFFTICMCSGIEKSLSKEWYTKNSSGVYTRINYKHCNTNLNTFVRMITSKKFPHFKFLCGVPLAWEERRARSKRLFLVILQETPNLVGIPKQKQNGTRQKNTRDWPTTRDL